MPSPLRTSFTAQLSLWLSAFVLTVYAVVVVSLARFSQQAVHDERTENARQALRNTALRIDNALRQARLTAQLRHQELTVDKSVVETLVRKGNHQLAISQWLPSARLSVADGPAAYTADTAADTDTAAADRLTVDVDDGRYSLVVTYDEADAFARYSGVQLRFVAIGLGGMLVLLVILYLVIARYLRPLNVLADAAQDIADGNLDTPIPDSRQDDEIGQMQSSLAKMQRSLATYMDEMQRKNDELKRQHSELQDAYDEARDYDRMKTAFLHNMTKRMAGPVDTVCRHTDTICQHCLTLSDKQMAALQDDMLAASDTITGLLDQLLGTTPSGQTEAATDGKGDTNA